MLGTSNGRTSKAGYKSRYAEVADTIIRILEPSHDRRFYSGIIVAAQLANEITQTHELTS